MYSQKYDERHHVYYKNFSFAEGYDLFKSYNPHWPHGRTLFQQEISKLYWLKNAKHSLALCVPCTNFKLMVDKAKELQLDHGLDEKVYNPYSTYDFYVRIFSEYLEPS